MNLKLPRALRMSGGIIALSAALLAGTAAAAHAESDPNNQPAQTETAGTDSGMFGMHSGGGSYDPDASAAVPAGVPPELAGTWAQLPPSTGGYYYTRTDGGYVTGGEFEHLNDYKGGTCFTLSDEKTVQCAG